MTEVYVADRDWSRVKKHGARRDVMDPEYPLEALLTSLRTVSTDLRAICGV